MPPAPSSLRRTKGPKRSELLDWNAANQSSLQPLLEQGDRDRAERQHPVMEGLHIARLPDLEEPLAQLQDLQLPERVAQIAGIEGPAVRLLLGGARVHEALLLEELLGLSDGHTFGVHAESGEEAAVAEQRVGELAELQLGVAVAVPLVEHHLLRVLRPA